MALTVVIAARVDDYLGRLKKSLGVWGELCCRHDFRPDFIIVEWNPPPDKPIVDELRPLGLPFPVRIITVSPEIHSSIPGSDLLPFFEYTAKNVGIRRAQDGFILTTNADDIYSSELVQALATNPSWNAGAFYRVNRHDVDIGCAEGANADEIIASCKAHVNRIVLAHQGAGGDFMLMHKTQWMAMNGHPELVSADTIDSYTIELAVKRGLQEIVFSEPLYHQGHEAQRVGWASVYDGVGPSAGAIARVNEGPWGLATTVLPEVTI